MKNNTQELFIVTFLIRNEVGKKKRNVYTDKNDKNKIHRKTTVKK